MQTLCQFCDKSSSNPGALAKHQKHCKNNPGYVKAFRSPRAGAKKGSTPWNKGKSGVYSSTTLDKMRSSGGHLHTEETKNKLSVIAKNSGLGGYTKNGGRGKKGYFKGIWCDSSWELAYVIFNLDHGHKIEKNSKGFPYEHEGKTKNYIPDFVLEDGTYVEIKGYSTEQWLHKQHHFSYPLVTLYKSDMNTYLSYVIEKYGKNFIDLYEK